MAHFLANPIQLRAARSAKNRVYRPIAGAESRANLDPWVLAGGFGHRF